MKTETRSGKELLQHVGRRVLVREACMSSITEVRVLEASPQGLVKLLYGLSAIWEDPDDYWLVEVLTDAPDYTKNPLPCRPFTSRAEQVATQWICSEAQHDIGNLTKFLAAQPEFGGEKR